jgi:predicted Rossmann-fold nucleotide-binding protein
MDFMRDKMIPEGTISPVDVERILFTDSPDEAMEFILKVVTGEIGLVWKPKDRPRWYLGESTARPRA